MILSRFWYFILTGVGVIGVSAALLASNLVNEQYERSAVNELVRDRFEVETVLKLDARARLDAITPIAANGDVRTALRRASARRAGTEINEEIRNGLRTKLTELNAQLRGMHGDILFAVDRNGWIVAGIAPGEIPDGAGVGQFPLVQRALEGYVRDDVWLYNDGVFRMAARPVVEGGQYVGALVHGKRFDDQLAELLSTRLDGASVGFFHGDEMVAGHMPTGGALPAPRRDDMGSQLEGVLEDERLQAGERTEPQELPTGGLAVYSLVTGTARSANVGYSIGRPVRSLGSPIAIFDQASGDAWAALPWPALGGGGVALFLLAMFFVWLERDRPLSKFLKASEALKGSPEDRYIITDFGGKYRKIARVTNDAMDEVAAAGGGPRRSAANLDEILGSRDEAPASGSFFGFSGDSQPAPDLPAVPPAGGPAGGLPPPGPPAKAAPAKPAPPKPAPPKKPAAGAPPPPKRPPPPATPPAKPAKPAATHDAPTAKIPTPDAPTAKIAAPPKASDDDAPRRALKGTLLGVPPPSDEDDDDDDGATMIARVPEELLARAAAQPDEEETHFKEVFEKFVAMKTECGEPTSSLTFAKFGVTLRKNRDQIIKRHGARKVRFTVYKKNGKAALKATPIKD